MIRRCPSFVLFFLALFAFPVGAADAQTVQVAGQVVSPTGQPISGADVSLQPAQGSASTVSSDTAGRFQFSGFEPGPYRITARAIGLSPVTQTVNISAGGSLDIALVMPEIVRERVNVVGDASLVEKIPGSAYVIERREMEKVKLATVDIHQMLRQVPGLNIQEEEGYGLRPNIGMSGTGTDRNSKITMMEDGVLIAPAPYAAPAAYYSPTAGRMATDTTRFLPKGRRRS